ncbi:CLUMA_CG008336, isoform A [Clunio marinus]|uniref:CLUMA_CG008336, isoform A n=1 Tax=Clunio marinus TaxID=568069 RepID=A0A1J1I5H9_9DIPT|nr:CLUMA_CG008336, isoform A [Clunio marinus]
MKCSSRLFTFFSKSCLNAKGNFTVIAKHFLLNHQNYYQVELLPREEVLTFTEKGIRVNEPYWAPPSHKQN